MGGEYEHNVYREMVRLGALQHDLDIRGEGKSVGPGGNRLSGG